MDFERILSVPFFLSSSHSIMLWQRVTWIGMLLQYMRPSSHLNVKCVTTNLLQRATWKGMFYQLIKEINLEIQLLSKVLQYQLITKKQFKFKSSACPTGGYWDINKLKINIKAGRKEKPMKDKKLKTVVMNYQYSNQKRNSK